MNTTPKLGNSGGNSKNRLGGEGAGSETDARLRTFDPLLPTIFGGNAFFDRAANLHRGCLSRRDFLVQTGREYSDVEREWFDGGEQDSEVFGVGGFSPRCLTVLFKNSLGLRKATSKLGRARVPPVDAPFVLESTRFLHGIRRSDRS